MITYDRKAAQNIERSYQTPEIIRQRLQTLSAMALRAGERVLDAGCGTGLLVETIAGIVGTSGSVVGIDCSNDMLDIARGRCADIAQVKLQLGSVIQLEQASDSFDAASCTQTLLYIDDVEAVLRELHRILKPGGRIAILETDWRGLVLNSADDEMTVKILKAWDHAVPSPNLPVKLTPLLRALNFSAIKVEAIPVLNTSYTADNFSASMLKYFADNAVRQNVISRAESKQWLQNLVELEQQDAYFFCVNRFLVTAVKS